ncbi:MAG: NAD(P)/FAD-dependent oxidoreductase, partial [Pseudomonadota bacterium]|nr:NAD(P)/FAD-dependent oxidoreductase [Pseudomonadota bacterium]
MTDQPASHGPAHIVIVGASHAGLSCAEKLRGFGFDRQITILDRDPGLPLQRPPLSKTYLKADLSDGEGAFALRKPDWFDNFDITFRPDCAAVSLDRTARTLSLSDGSHLSYDHLVLATGAEARPLPAAPDAANLHLLRTAADARALRAGLPDAGAAVVIGGGYIGLEAAASLRSLGIEVHVVEMAPRLLGRVASPALSDHCAALHQANGVHLHLGVAVDRLVTSAEGRIEAVRLADGISLACRLVLAGIGIIPETALAEAAGLTVDNGIVTDDSYTTSDAHISAIGDVAR